MNLRFTLQLWLNIGSTGFIFGGMFAVYTFVAEYLETVGGCSLERRLSLF